MDNPVVSVETSQPIDTKPKKNRLLLKIGIIISVFFIFILIAAFFAGTAYAWQSNKNVFFFSNVVEKTENLMMDNEKFITSKNPFSSILAPVSTMAGSDDLTSFFEADVSGDDLENLFGSAEDTQSYKYEYNFLIESHKTDNSDSDTESVNFDGSLNVNLIGANSNLNDDNKSEADIKGSYKAEGTTLEAEASIKTDNDNIYLYLKTIPTLGLFDLSEFKRKWWVYDLSDYQELLEETNTEPAEEDKLSKEELNKIADILNSDVIVNNITRKPDEVFGDVRAYCMELHLEKDEVKEVIEMINDSLEDEDSRMTDEDIEEIRKAVEYIKLGWCTGRRDNLLYKLSMESKFTAEGYEVNAKFEGKVWDYNVPVTIDVPDDAEDLKKYFEDMFQDTLDDYENYNEDDYNYDDYYYDDQYDYYNDNSIDL